MSEQALIIPSNGSGFFMKLYIPLAQSHTALTRHADTERQPDATTGASGLP
jgi:hypothetical protein